MTDIKNMIIKKASEETESGSYSNIMDPNFRNALKQRIIDAKGSQEDLLLLDNGCIYSVQTVPVVKKYNWNCKNGVFEIARTSRRKRRKNGSSNDVQDIPEENYSSMNANIDKDEVAKEEINRKKITVDGY